jgi:hypothetical protein
MADEISRLRGEGYLPIATFQYYEDYYDFAAEHHVRDFGIMAEAGAVIVNGSQAHRPKAMAFDMTPSSIMAWVTCFLIRIGSSICMAM